MALEPSCGLCKQKGTADPGGAYATRAGVTDRKGRNHRPLLSEDIPPKYLTPMRRHVVACLAPPLVAFDNAVLRMYSSEKP